MILRSLLGFFLLVGLSSSLLASGSGSLDFSKNRRLIDFSIAYPWAKLEPQVERRRAGFRRHLGAGGVSFNYQFLRRAQYGLSFNPGAWFILTNVNGSQKTFYSLHLELGPTYRFLPDSYLDPSISVTSGLARVGGLSPVYPNRLSYPLTSKFMMNLWRERDPFQDGALAFNVYSAFRYMLSAHSAFQEPWMLEFGLSFRGSF